MKIGCAMEVKAGGTLYCTSNSSRPICLRIHISCLFIPLCWDALSVTEVILSRMREMIQDKHKECFRGTRHTDIHRAISDCEVYTFTNDMANPACKLNPPECNEIRDLNTMKMFDDCVQCFKHSHCFKVLTARVCVCVCV